MAKEFPQIALLQTKYRGGSTIWLHGGSFKNAARVFAGAVVSHKVRQSLESEGSHAPGGSSEARRATCIWSGVHAVPHATGVHYLHSPGAPGDRVHAWGTNPPGAPARVMCLCIIPNVAPCLQGTIESLVFCPSYCFRAWIYDMNRDSIALNQS